MHRQAKGFAQNHKVIPAYIGSVGMFNDTKTVFVSPIMKQYVLVSERII
ncbi:TPA: hypothetical protein ACHTFF_001970 [Clostridioides difficile]|uniref:Uncharacterized protein n=1 Tax=Clostridioides difficile TaxID=1496 RepID=A0A069AED7_CLODI|nr:hypothetical protein [Clostridioides difficile]ERM22567.1 hypothetical protein QSW_3317 [Clostridioides difficile P41]EQF74010.1 hypothetical protein QGM_3298 [Clostridioides difficile CD211]EQK50772.1 hypothetical protein C675_3249 [Clostridioides difficile F525]EQK53556.1 hypothetical protein C673_3294 [Clostridioides difficile F200]EQK58391.1 hypothetical protein C676_3353 [Clostridioides difficile F548]